MEWVKKFLAKEGACLQAPVLAGWAWAKTAFHSSVVLPCLTTCWLVPDLTSKRESFLSSKNLSGFEVTVVLILVGTNCPGRGRKDLKCCREQNKLNCLIQKAARKMLLEKQKSPPDSGEDDDTSERTKKGNQFRLNKIFCLTWYLMRPFVKVPVIFFC